MTSDAALEGSKLIRTLVFFSFIASLASAEQVGKYEWKDVPRIVAMGDVYANLDKLPTILQGTGA